MNKKLDAISGPLSALKISYTGLDADKHLMDAVQFGRSIEGTSRIYNQALYVFEHGKAPGTRSIYHFKMYSSAPQSGSVFLGFQSLVATGQMAMYPQLWGKLATFLVPKIMQAVWNRLLNKSSENEKLIRFLQKESKENREFAKQITQMALNSVVQDKNH
ncbi:MAG: hypothetical protein IT560_13265, partial [Alphaproteobacteria bacterium]|nr:hypothetical protein [Alphaproteobacteria bacterium]